MYIHTHTKKQGIDVSCHSEGKFGLERHYNSKHLDALIRSCSVVDGKNSLMAVPRIVSCKKGANKELTYGIQTHLCSADFRRKKTYLLN